MSEPISCTTEIEVRYAETDQMGVVHHSVYLIWFELARTRLCLLSGYHYAEIEKLGYQLVVVATEGRYIKGARYGDTVAVTCWVEKLGSRGLRFAYEVRRGTEEGSEKLATGATEHVWVEARSGRPCRTPEPLREPFARLAAQTQTKS